MACDDLAWTMLASWVYTHGKILAPIQTGKGGNCRAFWRHRFFITIKLLMGGHA
jgi:hypothetical protein